MVKRLKCILDCLAEITAAGLLHAPRVAAAGSGSMRGGVTGIPGAPVDGVSSAHSDAATLGGVTGIPGMFYTCQTLIQYSLKRSLACLHEDVIQHHPVDGSLSARLRHLTCIGHGDEDDSYKAVPMCARIVCACVLDSMVMGADMPLCAGTAVSAGEPDAAAIAARKFQQAVLGELPSLVLQPGEAVRHHVAG